MSRRDRGASWGLGAAGLALAAAVLGSVVWGRVRAVEVPRVATWAGPVEVCATPDIDPSALRRAIRTWRDLGHNVRLGDRCDVSVRVDYLLEAHGICRSTATTEGQMVRSDCAVRVGHDALVLAHELGHALGYKHPRAAPTGHLLHPSSPGWDARGLEVTP